MAPHRIHKKAAEISVLALLLGSVSTCAALSATSQDMGAMTVFRVPTEVQSFAKPTQTFVQSGAQKGHTATPKATTSNGSSAARLVPTGFLDIASSVSPAFVNEIEIAMQKLPTNTVKALAAHGYKVCISRTVPDAVPAARNQQVRGYEPSATWNSVFGMFNRSTKRVVMAETAELPDGAGGTKVSRLTNRDRRQGIVRHEFGHAVDQYLGNFSHTPQFKAAYDHGAAEISAPERQVLSYYLQPGDAGKEETFAELFAALDEDACDKNSDILLRNHFSQLAKLIRQKVASI